MLSDVRSALVARYEFNNQARNSGEPVSHYVATLKHWATECGGHANWVPLWPNQVFAIGSITTRCLGNEPALLPQRHGWTHEDSFVSLNQSDNGPHIFVGHEWSCQFWLWPMMRYVQKCRLMRCKLFMISITKCPLSQKVTKTHIILSNMK